MRRRVVFIAVAVVVIASAAGVLLVPHSSDEPAVALAGPARGQAQASASALALVQPLDRFGLALLRRQASTSPQGNVLVSPVSLHAVLSMVLNGARGETAEQMRTALGLGSLPLGEADQGWADLITLSQSGDKPEVSLADSLWLRRGIAFRQPFLNANRDFFAAETHELPDDPNRAAADINDWVEKGTNGRITKLVRPEFFTDQTLLALFNTVYLKVHWKHFDKADTQPEAFTLPDGSRADVLMMHADVLETDVVLADDYDAVALGTDGPVTVWVIVPKEGRLTADELLNKLDARALEELYARAESFTGSLALPKFTTRYEAQDLNGDLSAMGMPRAFSPDEAEFQGIADVDQLYVSKVVQKTFMELNEQGVEAAAGSGVMMEMGLAPAPGFSIRADHPFLVVLTEKATSAPLFMGLIRDPRGE